MTNLRRQQKRWLGVTALMTLASQTVALFKGYVDLGSLSRNVDISADETSTGVEISLALGCLGHYWSWVVAVTIVAYIAVARKFQKTNADRFLPSRSLTDYRSRLESQTLGRRIQYGLATGNLLGPLFFLNLVIYIVGIWAISNVVNPLQATTQEFEQRLRGISTQASFSIAVAISAAEFAVACVAANRLSADRRSDNDPPAVAE